MPGSTTTKKAAAAGHPAWPPSRQQLARMFEEGYESYEKNDKKGLGRGAMSWHECESPDQAVPIGEGGVAASLSPHHEGYDAETVTKQRLELLTKAAAERTNAAYVAEVELEARREEAAAAAAAAGGLGEPDKPVAGKSNGAAAGGGGNEGSSTDNWTWAKPQPEGQRQASGSGLAQIPVLARTLLTASEVTTAMEALGGMDVAVVDVVGKGNLDAEAMIFVSGRSGAHLRRMADVLVQALKAREIGEREAPGVTGAEGYDCEDWMIVDGGNVIVHLMEPSQRKALDLEAFWGAADFKGITLPPGAAISEAAWDAAHDKALDANPSDEGYTPEKDDHAKRERELRRVLNAKSGKRMR